MEITTHPEVSRSPSPQLDKADVSIIHNYNVREITKKKRVK